MSRYPALQLKDAVEGVEKLFAEIQRSSVDGTTASKALGYSSENGAARTKLGALNAYGLIDRGKKLVNVTDLGIAIAHPLQDSRERGLREAALRPALFKEIWDNHRQCSESVLASTLVHKGLDTGSAAQAAKIFKANIAFAGLTDSNYNPSEKPPLPHVDQGGGGAAETTKQKTTPPMTANVRYLPIPLDIGEAPIPVGMSDSDFDLLLDTLKLWKKKIVRSEYPRAAVWRNKDQDKPVTITGLMGEKEGEKYYQTSEGTGVPESELEFED
jgi:hypothetical protein